MTLNKLFLSAAIAAGSAFAVPAFADAVYSTVPGDVSQVVVSNGTTTVVGLDLYRGHLKQYWKFDAENDKFTNSVGTVTLSAYAGTPVYTNDAKIGGGALFMDKGIRASENVLDGKKPFTIMFWTKRTEWTTSQHTLLHVGKKLKQDGAQIQDVNNYIRLSYGNSSNNGYSRLYFWENHIENASGLANSNIGTADRWNHVALTCATVESGGAVASNRYTEVVNGVEYKVADAPQTDFQPGDYFLFGYGWHYEGGTRSGGNMFIDEIMIFDKALTTAEINEIKDISQPFDFSANWHMTKGSGTLDIPGGFPQNVTGYGGTVNTDAGLVLAPSRNATYAGEVSGASLTLDAASSSVTQTIAGVNTYSGETRVKKGVLAVNPMAAFPELAMPLVAYWPCDAFSLSGVIADMSGNGNHLYPRVGVGDLSVDAENCIADGALHFPRTGDEMSGFTSAHRLNGFVNGDNSYTVALWVRTDGVNYREGIFSFSEKSGTRFNGKPQSLYFGDRYNSKIVTAYTLPTSDGSFGDGKWRHIAVAYDKDKADGTQDCYFLYMNGCQAYSSPNFDAVNHAAEPFYLGLGVLAAQGSINGALDDVVVLNGVSATDVAALYNWRRGAHEAGGETSVLPDTTRVVVDAGATLFITNANERVRAIAGAGTIHIAAGSSLYAKSRREFTGTITGGGAFRCPGLYFVIQ